MGCRRDRARARHLRGTLLNDRSARALRRERHRPQGPTRARRHRIVAHFSRPRHRRRDGAAAVGACDAERWHCGRAEWQSPGRHAERAAYGAVLDARRGVAAAGDRRCSESAECTCVCGRDAATAGACLTPRFASVNLHLVVVVLLMSVGTYLCQFMPYALRILPLFSPQWAQIKAQQTV